MKLVEIKVWAASLGTLLASIVLAVLNAVLADNTILGNMPPVLQTLILVIIPPVIAFLSGYAKRSGTSNVSDKYLDVE
jgi:hypothetical protein